MTRGIDLYLGPGYVDALYSVGVLRAVHQCGYEIRSITARGFGAFVASLFAYNRDVRWGTRYAPRERQEIAILAVEDVLLETEVQPLQDRENGFAGRYPDQAAQTEQPFGPMEAWLEPHFLLPSLRRGANLGELRPPSSSLSRALPLTIQGPAEDGPNLSKESHPTLPVHRAVRASMSEADGLVPVAPVGAATAEEASGEPCEPAEVAVQVGDIVSRPGALELGGCEGSGDDLGARLALFGAGLRDCQRELKGEAVEFCYESPWQEESRPARARELLRRCLEGDETAQRYWLHNYQNETMLYFLRVIEPEWVPEAGEAAGHYWNLAYTLWESPDELAKLLEEPHFIMRDWLHAQVFLAYWPRSS